MKDPADKFLGTMVVLCLLALAVITPAGYLVELQGLNAQARASMPGCHNGHWKCRAHWERGQVKIETTNAGAPHV